MEQETLEEFDFFARGTGCAAKEGEGGEGGEEAWYDKVQKGVFRVNCVDCLDRTNVAQSVLE